MSLHKAVTGHTAPRCEVHLRYPDNAPLWSLDEVSNAPLPQNLGLTLKTDEHPLSLPLFFSACASQHFLSYPDLEEPARYLAP